MGASQSSEPGGESHAGNTGQRQSRTCYYDILGVDVKATEDEIKKAYRRKALELHPDRNYGNTEAVTAQFANVQSAYEILSDPQERSWYDTHRDAILSNIQDGESPSQVITTEDVLGLLAKFNSRIDYSDKPNGFYGALDDFFSKLAQEEALASESEGQIPITYVGFGRAADKHDDGVRTFYAQWNSFATRKTFSWKDKYRYSDAPDRKIRRLMEKENKQFREEAIKEFNDAVRSVVAFLKKRDPRYQPNKQSEADRQKVLQDAAAAQAARSRASHLANTSLQEDQTPKWMKTRADKDVEDVLSEWEAEDEVSKEEFECVLCDKTFKSEKQFEAHERSKKHLKAAQQIKRQMQRENVDLELDQSKNGLVNKAEDSVEVSERQDDHNADGSVPPSEDLLGSHLSQSEAGLTETDFTGVTDGKNSAKVEDPISEHLTGFDSSDEDVDYDYASRNEVEKRILDGERAAPRQGPRTADGAFKSAGSNFAHMSLDDRDEKATDEEHQQHSQTPKLGKAKQKRAKKAAASKGKGSSSTSELQCVQCGAAFPSKNQLFGHIKDLGHAQFVPKASAKVGKGKR